MRILIHHDNASIWREALAARLPAATIATSNDNDSFQADYLVAWKPTAVLFETQKSLRGIINMGAGVDALLANPSLPRDVPIVKLRDAGMGVLIADYCRYALLHFRRGFDRYQQQEATANWRPLPVIPARDWSVGVLGLGAIGAQVASALATDGYLVHGWSRSPKSIDGVTCHHGDAGLIGMLARLHTLIALLPETADTRGLLNAHILAQLPAGATLINPGRGALIDETALLDALGSSQAEGALRGAMLDVFADEPLPSASPLWQHPRIRITPHVAGPTPIETAADQVATHIRAMEAGEAIETVDRQRGY